MKVSACIIVGELRSSGTDWHRPKSIRSIRERRSYLRPGTRTREITLRVLAAEAVLGVEAAINDWIGGEIGLLYETVNIGLDDGEDGTSTVVDVATLTIGAPEGSWSFAAGRQYAPFGVFATNLISDPLTLELGEANDLVVQFGLSSGGLHGSIFGFYDDNAQNGGYGAVTGYSLERREIEFGLHLSYISDIGASDNLQGVVAESRDVNENVPGWIASTELGKDVS